MSFVLSTQARANIVNVDASKALSLKGVVDYISYDDIPGSNYWGSHNPIFADKEVKFKLKFVIGCYFSISIFFLDDLSVEMFMK